jgi:hypothetical protein
MARAALRGAISYPATGDPRFIHTHTTLQPEKPSTSRPHRPQGHLQDRGSQGEEQEGAVSGYGIYRTQLTE